MRAMLSFLLLFNILSFYSCTSEDKIDMNTAHNEVLNILSNYQTAHETRDIEMLRNCFSDKPDIIILGTDEKELWVDRESLLQEQERFYKTVDNVKLSIRDKVVKMCATGKNAWFYMKVNWLVQSGDNTHSLNNIRTTGVVNKENDKWGIVMMHTSLPVKGQAVEY